MLHSISLIDSYNYISDVRLYSIPAGYYEDDGDDWDDLVSFTFTGPDNQSELHGVSLSSIFQVVSQYLDHVHFFSSLKLIFTTWLYMQVLNMSSVPCCFWLDSRNCIRPVKN